ncbi:MAG: hypothetical protein OHK0039_25220 [Bacteroidia bacterium]
MLHPAHLLRLATIALLAGRAWQHIFWDSALVHVPMPAPLTSLWLSVAIGAILAILALLLALPGRHLHRLYAWLPPVAAVLLGDALIAAHMHHWALPECIEHSLQWGTPLGLWLLHRGRETQAWRLLRLCAALTFAGHGLYALGWPEPTPTHFLAMTQQILGFLPATAHTFLQLAGSLDLLVCVGIFVPRLAPVALLYATCWGLLTALARPVAYFDDADMLLALHRWLPEMVFRLPHGLVPLALLRQLRH